VSRATASLLGERFEMVSRGVIPVKGKGELETFFVDGERAVKDAA
jgi:hypothetical protein